MSTAAFGRLQQQLGLQLTPCRPFNYGDSTANARFFRAGKNPTQLLADWLKQLKLFQRIRHVESSRNKSETVSAVLFQFYFMLCPQDML
jgi:hypothetical protein